MTKLLMFLLIAAMLVTGACSQDKPDKKEDLVFVEGGPIKNNKSNYAGQSMSLSSFYIGKYEVTQKSGRKSWGAIPRNSLGINCRLKW